MLRSRIIPTLLIHNNGLVKTINFSKPKYVGDPINAVRIFNEKEVDELSFFDIDASILGKEPNYSLIEKLANQSRMPLCYGGGIKTVEQAQRIFSLGIEKIALSSAALENPKLLQNISEKVGSQSVVVVLDVKKKILGGYEIYTHNGKKSWKVDPISFIKEIEKYGIGEIIINSIDRDGKMNGYDLNLIDQVASITELPLTVLGGAGSLRDFIEVVKIHKIIGLSAGSMFVFKGPYKAVLINYPSKEEKEKIYKEAIWNK